MQVLAQAPEVPLALLETWLSLLTSPVYMPECLSTSGLRDMTARQVSRLARITYIAQ